MALPGSGSAWKLLKFLVHEAGYPVPSVVSYLESLLDHSEPAAPVQWMRWVTEFTRTTPAGTSEDRAQFKLDLLNITSGAVDTTWTSGDFAACKAAFDSFWTNYGAHISDRFTAVGYKAYQMSFNPADPGPGNRSAANGYAFNPTGPPRYAAVVSFPGAGASTLPYQVSMAVTLKTGWPKHWGRIYLPPPATADMGSNGRFGTTVVSSAANSVKILGDTLSDANFLPVVPVTDLNKQAFHGLLGVMQYQADDVPDIQRRRRGRNPATRVIV